MSDGQTARQIALSLPDACEVDHFGAPSFRVHAKIFAQLSKDETEALVKLPKHYQAELIDIDPASFASEPQWGRYGWTRIQLAGVPPDLLKTLLVQSWRVVAPKPVGRAHPEIKGLG